MRMLFQSMCTHQEQRMWLFVMSVVFFLGCSNAPSNSSSTKKVVIQNPPPCWFCSKRVDDDIWLHYVRLGSSKSSQCPVSVLENETKKGGSILFNNTAKSIEDISRIAYIYGHNTVELEIGDVIYITSDQPVILGNLGYTDIDKNPYLRDVGMMLYKYRNNNNEVKASTTEPADKNSRKALKIIIEG